MNQQRPEVADVIRSCKTDFLTRYRVSQQQRKALQDMESCRNCHCPKCQGSRQAQWLEARAAELLPVPSSSFLFAPSAVCSENISCRCWIRLAARVL